jgi:hypothetical protein
MGYTWVVQYRRPGQEFSKFSRKMLFENAERVKARLLKAGFKCWMYDVAVY